MRFAVLGALEVSANGASLPLGGRKQRTLLAILLLHANERVSRDRLLDALWGELPPPSADVSLDTYIYRLRKLIGHERLVRTAGGYVLRVEPGELDVDQFERLIGIAGRAMDAGDHRGAAVALGDGLALWRGSAWADLLDRPLADGELHRLEELRLSALESRIDAELAMGRGPELVPELEQLASEHPLRERLLAALMLALYRAGRQASALDVFRAARDRLVDELGLEPGPELHELQRRILQHDPSLTEPRHVLGRRPRAHRAVATLVALAVAAVTVAAVLSSGTPPASRALGAGTNGLLGVNTRSGEIATATALTGAPGALASGAGSIWVADPSNATVARIDSRSGLVSDRIAVGAGPGSIVSGDGEIWVASTIGATVTRIDPATGTVTQRIPLHGLNPDAIAYGADRLWLADSTARELFEIDPRTGSVLRTVSLHERPSAVAIADGALWVAGYDSATVEKLDPRSGRTIGRAQVGTGPVALAFAGGALWVANSLDATISRVDPRTLAVRAIIPVRSGPSALTTDTRSVWVASRYSDSVSRIDPARDEVVRTLALRGQPTSLAADGGRLWAGVAGRGVTHRGGTLVMLTSGSFGSVDPAFFIRTAPPQFGGLAYDTLVTFQHVGGSDGLRLVPDLALAIPAPTNTGSVYEFRIRPRIRYSDGRILRAGDFRRAIERLFRAGSPGRSYFAGIVGAAQCARRPAGCDLSQGIVTDDAAGTVVFHLTAPDPEFVFKLSVLDYAAPIPPGTADREPGATAPPGTGPYRIARVDHAGVRFVRNAFFREWSHAAQPDGNPDSIVWRYPVTPHDAVVAIEHGRGDWMLGLIPTTDYHRLRLQEPGLLRSNRSLDVNFVHINTHRAPFNDLRVRRALNYAVNRATIAKLDGGDSFATPTCQPLAPGLPGYRRYCPYTKQPRPDGAWTAPDPKRARRLVNASGTRGQRVDVWGATDLAFAPRSVPAYLVAVLRSLGYQARLRLAPFASITPAMRARFQLEADGDWVADYPDPTSYIPQYFGCDGGLDIGYYCDPHLDSSMREASALELTDPAAATVRWTAIDRRLTDNAAWVPTENLRDVQVVSPRLRNYQYNPMWGFLADQAWLR